MIVVDPSVAIKWIQQDEKYRKLAVSLYRSHIEGNDKIVVPHFFFIEVANVLATKSNTSESKIKHALDYIFRMQLIVQDIFESEIIEASIRAKKYGVAVFDMLYVVVADRHNIPLITADEKFVKKTKFPFVKLISEIAVRQ